ncbi:MAG: protein kinase domain-containing protein [Solirubrobacterales bacterium]
METRSTSAQMIGTVLSGRYRLKAKLGSGGMSTVYLARDVTLDRPVAVKVMHREMSEQPDQLERFRREARAVAKLSHPNVVAVIDAGEDRGHPYIVFEYVEGENLKQRIKRLGPLDPQEALAYAIEVARGLTVAHRRKLVHRDVKPQNVLIDAEGRAKVTDFGIARQLEQQGVTDTGRVLGTTDYVSPEQAMGHGVDPRSDVYSLGVVLYEMLTGDVPFSADTQVGVAMKHVNEELPDVQRRRPELSAAAAWTIERATTKDPAKRYRGIDEMIGDLETALAVEAARAGSTEGEATTVLKAVRPKHRWLRGRSRRWLAGGLAVLLLFAAAIAAVVIISSGDVGGGGAERTGTAVQLSDVSDFDPPPGDLSEDPDQVDLVTDGNPTTTSWATDHYDTSDWGGIKDGVGIYVEASRPVAAREMEVRTTTPGWDAEVYSVADSPPDELSGWGEPIGTVSDAGSRQTIRIRPSGLAQNYLLWFTDASSSREQTDRYQVAISDIKLIS